VRYREKCLASDIDDILSKPYTLDDCRRVLQQWLARGDAAAAVPAAPETDAVVPPTHASLASVDGATVAALRQLGGGRQGDLYVKLVDLFRTSSAQSLAELDAALAGDDLTAAAAVCHKLASAAANVGALAFAERVRELERRALAGEREAARDLRDALRGAHMPLVEALQGQRLRAAG
jgi:HPt (histidine-containing phosphotransfer) domain-containing protein